MIRTGDVSVEWKTSSDSSTSTDGSDYQGDIGTINMADGERWSKIDIEIIDNDIAELMKTFRVILDNPTGGGMMEPFALRCHLSLRRCFFAYFSN